MLGICIINVPHKINMLLSKYLHLRYLRNLRLK